jgi:hypothetical protein
MLNRVLPEWRARFDPDNPYWLDIPIRTYITAGAACASKERFEIIGRWADVVRGVDIHGLGVKRKLDGRVFDLYLSGSPIKRPIDRALIRKRAELLGS